MVSPNQSNNNSSLSIEDYLKGLLFEKYDLGSGVNKLVRRQPADGESGRAFFLKLREGIE